MIRLYKWLAEPVPMFRFYCYGYWIMAILLNVLGWKIVFTH